MSIIKDIMQEVIQSQSNDASYEENMRELAFERMVIRGMESFRQGRVLSNKEMGQRIRTWRK